MPELVAPLEFKFADDSATPGTFEGYGAFFANKDSYGDVIQKGAFKDSLKEWKAKKKMPPMLAQHGGWMMTDMDAIPIGKWESLSEDDSGLYVKGRLINLETERGKNIHGAMKEGVLDGMSIGYRAKEFSYGTKPDEPRRTLKRIDIVEISVVTFPANDKARVQAVKSLRDLDSEDFREIEASLRTKGLSRSDAVKAVSGLKEWLQREAGEPGTDPRDEDEAGELAALIRRNTETLTWKGK